MSTSPRRARTPSSRSSAIRGAARCARSRARRRASATTAATAPASTAGRCSGRAGSRSAATAATCTSRPRATARSRSSRATRKTGELTQLPGTDGCVGESSLGGACADGKALIGARGIAVSRDGRHVYVGSASSNAVAVFARDRKTGALTQLPGTDGCVSEDGTNGECADGKALLNAGAVAVSDDGKSVYVASFQSGAVAVFARQRR
ncbi:MAG: beta-propeller fold lactonase family protein [Thermodesulfobacteriota bacterium]